MIRKSIVSFFCLASFSAYSALPPFYQSRNEIQAILSSPALIEQLGSVRPIQKIKKTSNGYQVSTNQCKVHVWVKYISSQKIGPRRFTLDVSPVVCR